MDVADDEVVKRHVLGTVFLGQVHVAERLRQYRAELVVRFQVHSKAFPKIVAVGHDASFFWAGRPRAPMPLVWYARRRCAAIETLHSSRDFVWV